MRKLVAGVDGSSRGAAALGWAARLAVRTDAELVVASAWRPRQAEGTEDDFAARRAVAQQLLDGEWSEAARAAGVPHPRTALLNGSPDTLVDAACEMDADLVVVGSRGAGGFAALHIGSVAHHLAHHTRRPLAIVPEPTAGDRIETIVVGVDGSAGSAAAVRWCASFAPALQARVVAVHAFEPFVEWVPESDPKSWRRVAEWELGVRIEPLRDAHLPVEAAIVEDIHPVAAIADTAVKRSAQLIVVGTRGMGGFSNMRIGGVALQLVHHLGRPVVLVPLPNSDDAH